MARVRRLLVFVLGVASACAPDASDTAFRCDTDRGGHHGCPSGQGCVYGRCRRGGATGMVECGAETCTERQQCCVDGTNPPRCIAADATCPGIAALCDDRADCASGDYCCGGETTACGGSCAVVTCLDGVLDCPSDSPNCCFDTALSGLDVPWGSCSPLPCD